MLRQLAQLLLLFALGGVSIAVPAQIAAPCAITTLSEKIGGGTIVYNTVGKGPSILLIHGLFADKEQWTDLACRLADAGYAPIAVDLPGYGKSDRFSLSAYRLENQVDKLHTLMTRLNIERFDVAGNSMGGAIASLYARRYSQQVRSVAFIGSPLGIIAWSPEMHSAIYRGINPFIPITQPQLDLELQLLFVAPPAIPEPVKKEIVANYVLHNLHFVQIWNIVNLYNDILATRPLARTPTLIVWGDDDHIYNIAGAQKLQRRIAGSELHRLPHAGHLLHVENAADVAPMYVNFLKSSVPSARANAPAPPSGQSPAASIQR
jgi:abhydrolase domain-containing protein 6